jgi:hypothetical protein
LSDCSYPPGCSTENSDETAAAAVVKTPQRRTTLLSQLSQCEEEGGEEARAATDALSLVQVSQSLGCYLPVPFLIIALLFFSFLSSCDC